MLCFLFIRLSLFCRHPNPGPVFPRLRASPVPALNVLHEIMTAACCGALCSDENMHSGTSDLQATASRSRAHATSSLARPLLEQPSSPPWRKVLRPAKITTSPFTHRANLLPKSVQPHQSTLLAFYERRVSLALSTANGQANARIVTTLSQPYLSRTCVRGGAATQQKAIVSFSPTWHASNAAIDASPESPLGARTRKLVANSSLHVPYAHEFGAGSGDP